jgi:hypothetical protein
MREPTDEEREDARIETMERRAERERRARAHQHTPECGCDDEPGAEEA